MGKTTAKSKGNRSKCLNCCQNLSKLKELCNQKGLATSFNKKHKPCKKHKKDNVVTICNSYNFDKVPKDFRKLLADAIFNAYKQIQKAKLLKRKSLLKIYSHLDEFTVEDVSAHVSQKDVSKPSGAPTVEEQIVVDDKDSEVTEIFFVKPPTPPRRYIPNELDSLGLLNCTEEFPASQRLDKVKMWTQYGYPYVDELPASQYDIPAYNDDQNPVGWISPALSPIHS